MQRNAPRMKKKSIINLLHYLNVLIFHSKVHVCTDNLTRISYFYVYYVFIFSMNKCFDVVNTGQNGILVLAKISCTY